MSGPRGGTKPDPQEGPPAGAKGGPPAPSRSSTNAAAKEAVGGRDDGEGEVDEGRNHTPAPSKEAPDSPEMETYKADSVGASPEVAAATASIERAGSPPTAKGIRKVAVKAAAERETSASAETAASSKKEGGVARKDPPFESGGGGVGVREGGRKRTASPVDGEGWRKRPRPEGSPQALKAVGSAKGGKSDGGGRDPSELGASPKDAAVADRSAEVRAACPSVEGGDAASAPTSSSAAPAAPASIPARVPALAPLRSPSQPHPDPRPASPTTVINPPVPPSATLDRAIRAEAIRQAEAAWEALRELMIRAAIPEPPDEEEEEAAGQI